MKDQEPTNKGAEQGKQQWDAFDQDAADGFALLNSEQAVASLKAETDEAMKARLNATKSASSKPWYRIAIAAVFIFGGLAVALWLLPETKKEMALQQETITSDMPEQTSAELEVLSETTAKQVTPPTSPSTDMARKVPAENNRMSSQAPVIAKDEEAEASPSSDQMAAAEMTAKADMLASTAEREEKSAPAYQERKKLEAPLKKSKALSAPAPVVASPAVVSSGAATYAWNANASTDSVAVGKENSIKTIALINTTSYPGGNRALQKDVRKILEKENAVRTLLLQFDIDKTGKVIKVQTLAPSGLSKEKEQGVLDALKGVKAFKVTLVEGGQLPAIYNFDFKP